MRPALRQATNFLARELNVSHTSIPIFLCPALLRAPTPPTLRPKTRPDHITTFSTARRKQQDAAASPSEPPADHATVFLPPKPARDLPISCPGCGAPSQTVEKKEAGYYSLDRSVVNSYLNYDGSQPKDVDNSIYTTALQRVDAKVLQELGLDKNVLTSTPEKPAPSTPICDRCHNLLHHHTGVSIHHPSVAAIQETIAESPHRRNHIYHVIDAADFPMSLVPNLQTALKLPRLRTQNRRSRHRGWVSGDRIAEVSFIITRSDLLAPLKEQVDRLMPYIQEVLRGALGRVGRNARLGNVRLVSAMRGWWTKEVKEDIWERGGGGWMVGKVNVGKSNLFEVVFPKGRGGTKKDINVRKIKSAAEREQMQAAAKSVAELAKIQEQLAEEDEEIARAAKTQEQADIKPPPDTIIDQDSNVDLDDLNSSPLLPPPQPETPFPTMPIISSLPGTTASPIRIPFGNKRGELIDLPGLARTTPSLESFVKPEDRASLVMTHRITPEQCVLKPGKSLLLGGGLIRITPKTEGLIFIAHPFVPLHPHITSLEKATGIQTQTLESGIETIMQEGIGSKIRSAGTIQLKWDVTRRLAGPLTNPKAGKMKPEKLPFVIYSADILIEGVGWVELVAQVRKPKHIPPPSASSYLPPDSSFRLLDPEAGNKRELDAFDRAEAESSSPSFHEMSSPPPFPEIEIFTPEGKFIGVRQPMSASLLGGPKPKSRNERKSRPRLSMRSLKMSRRGRERRGVAVGEGS